MYIYVYIYTYFMCIRNVRYHHREYISMIPCERTSGDANYIMFNNKDNNDNNMRDFDRKCVGVSNTRIK